MALVLNPNYDLYRKNDKGFCDSLQIAETFGRRHKHILDTIYNLTEPTSGLSETFIKDNFTKTSYIDGSGKRNPKYLLTKDGFIMVTMEFKTKKARQFKEAYIKRFNDMAEFITVLSDVKEDFPEFTDAVKLSKAEPKSHHYINEINMIYSLVLGQSVQSFKKEQGITDGNIRDCLSTEQLLRFRQLQRMDIGLLLSVPELQQRKKILKNNMPALTGTGKDPVYNELS